MQKIRIGNDVRLNITLKGSRVYNQSSIKQLRCYLINTEYENLKTDFHECKNEYVLHRCGCPTYHVMPFGYHPRRPMQLFDKPAPIDHKKPFMECDNFIAPNVPRECMYLAPSKVTSKENGAIVYFPARDQRMLGIYRLVVCVVIFEPGWGKTELRTYTIDYGSVLELVDNEEGVSGDITIDVDTDSTKYNKILKIEPINDTLTCVDGSITKLGDNDYYSRPYNIRVYLENGSFVLYDPDNWPYEKLTFTSRTEKAVTVDANTGTIKINALASGTCPVTITSASGNATATFNVEIYGGDYNYIGFAPVRPFPKSDEDDSSIGFDRDDDSYESDSQENITGVGADELDLSDLEKVKDLTIPVNVKNTTDGYYLWIASTKPIAMAIDTNGESYATSIPLTAAQFSSRDNLYYYACPNPVKADTTFGSYIYVKFK